MLFNETFIFKFPNAVGRAVTRLYLEREVCGSNLGTVKSDTAKSATCHRCDISSKEDMLPTGTMTRYMLRPIQQT